MRVVPAQQQQLLLLLLHMLASGALMDPTECQQGQPEPVPPPFNETVIRAFREKLLLNPPPVPDRNPYSPPQPPPPPPGWETAVCGVLYDDEDTRQRYRLVNYTDADAARADGAHITHETPCGLCSSLEDLAVRKEPTAQLPCIDVSDSSLVVWRRFTCLCGI